MVNTKGFSNRIPGTACSIKGNPLRANNIFHELLSSSLKAKRALPLFAKMMPPYGNENQITIKELANRCIV